MKKIHIDFQIYDSNDPKRIIILDTSIWANIEDKPAVIEILTPGEKDPVVYVYTKNGITILNSHTLGLNCSTCGDTFYDIPDGIYEITVKGSPDKFYKKRHYLRTTIIQSRIDELLVKHYTSDCGECTENSLEISKILRYKDLLSVAEAFVRKGHICQAQEILFKVQYFINKFNNCRKCPHKA
jgi:hypothetical protein